MQEIEYYDAELHQSMFYVNGNWYMDEPSQIFGKTCKVYTLDGKFHREDGPAIEYPDGSKVWYKHGFYHRLDGPAIEYPDGYKVWYKHGLHHCEDGPAIEYVDGTKVWYLNGEVLTEKEFLEQCKK